MHRYRAVVESVAPWTRRDTYLTEYRRCVLGISLGSRSSEGARFEAAVRWVAENYDECALGVGDGMYRYTLQVTDGRSGNPRRDMTPEAWHALAIEAGREFQQHAEQIVAPYRDQCRFTWYPMSRIVAGSSFREDLAAYRALYETNDPYRNLVHEFAAGYLARVLQTDGTSPPDPAHHQAACDYLLEESAIFTQLCREGWELLVYPGSIAMFSAIAEGRFPEVPDPIKRLVHVALKLKRGSLFFAESTEYPYPALPDDHVHADSDEDAIAPGVLCEFGEDEWRRFMPYTTRRHMLAGEILAPAGDLDRSLYILLEGDLEVLDGDWRSGKLTQLSTHHPGSVLGERSFVDGRPRTTTVAALGECEVLVLPQKQMQRMRQRDPALAAALLFDISRELALKG